MAVYTENDLLKPDNNVAENAIRPFLIGRRNWFFAGHPNGAKSGATFFSMIEAAKADGLEPFAYLRYSFQQLPFVKEQSEYQNRCLKLLIPNLLIFRLKTKLTRNSLTNSVISFFRKGIIAGAMPRAIGIPPKSRKHQSGTIETIIEWS